MATTSVVGRVAAIAALIGAAIVVLLLVLGGGTDYTVTAEFQNASQLVNGNQVTVGGDAVGTVQQIALGDHGQALVKFTGLRLRAASRGHHRPDPLHVALVGRRPPDRPHPAPLELHGPSDPYGGDIPQADTTSEVDLDQVFNTLSPRPSTTSSTSSRASTSPTTGSAPRPTAGFTT